MVDFIPLVHQIDTYFFLFLPFQFHFPFATCSNILFSLVHLSNSEKRFPVLIKPNLNLSLSEPILTIETHFSWVLNSELLWEWSSFLTRNSFFFNPNVSFYAFSSSRCPALLFFGNSSTWLVIYHCQVKWRYPSNVGLILYK